MNIKYYILVGLSLFVFASCDEQDDAIDEFADWKNKNDQYFETAFLSHDYDVALRKYSLGDDADTQHTDYVLVEMLDNEDGAPEAMPYLTDTVLVHYVGRLIPSPSFSEGYQFDQSYLPPFDWDTAVPSKFALNTLTAGFSTALQKMHRGDHWMVMIPYQLGYGTSDYNDIPAYSTLIFEILLEDFWTKEKGDRY